MVESTAIALRSIRPPSFSKADKTHANKIKEVLGLSEHLEGGYFLQTDKDPRLVDNPFSEHSQEDATRSASTTIFYLLTPDNAVGHFHRNKARTMHTHHKGRGMYIILHADEATEGKPVRIESFIVGPSVENGEKLQWVVEGGKYKASFLLPDEEGSEQSNGLLISETVVPGFEFSDHDFLQPGVLQQLTTAEQARQLSWLLLEHAHHPA